MLALRRKRHDEQCRIQSDACADGIPQGGGPYAETSALDAALGATGFVYLDKSDDPMTPAGIGGVSFVVNAGTGNSGSWTMSWTEQPGAPNLPLTIDFAVGLFGGNTGAGYFFDNVPLPRGSTTGSGSYDVNYLNSGGQQPNLAHLLLAGGNVAATFNTVSAVPEPTMLALLAVGLAGLGFSHRKQQSISRCPGPTGRLTLVNAWRALPGQRF